MLCCLAVQIITRTELFVAGLGSVNIRCLGVLIQETLVDYPCRPWETTRNLETRSCRHRGQGIYQTKHLGHVSSIG